LVRWNSSAPRTCPKRHRATSLPGYRLHPRRKTRALACLINSSRSRRENRSACKKHFQERSRMVHPHNLCQSLPSQLPVSRRVQRTDTTTSGPLSILASSCRMFLRMVAITLTPTTFPRSVRTSGILPLKAPFLPHSP
jgi:hypothetical protein